MPSYWQGVKFGVKAGELKLSCLIALPTISLSLKKHFFDNELDEIATTEEISVVQKEGNRKVSRKVNIYNLDAIISVGFM